MRKSSHSGRSGPRGLAGLKASVGLVRSPLPTLVDGHAQFGDLLQMQLGPLRLWSVLDPDAVHHVLVHNAKNYRKSPAYRALSMVLGNGLVTSDGETWKRQRKLSQPAFHHRAVAQLTEVMSDCTSDLLGDWERQGSGTEIDTHAEMMALTMRIVGKALFGAELQEDRDRIYEALGVAMARAQAGLEELTLVPTWLPTPQNIRFRRAKNTLDDIVYRIIEQRRRSEPRQDVLGLLMAATDDGNGVGMNDEQLRDEVMTLFVAGHETVANAMSWAWVCLNEHPEVERKLVEETGRVLGGRTPRFDDIPKLPYTAQVIDEVLRLFPPAWIIERQAIGDDTIMGRPLPPKTLVSVCTYLLHRHPDLWDDPERFDPERFTPERSKGRHRYAYIPFGAGPRICIGNAFAKMEAVIVLAGLVQRWQLKMPARRPGLDPGITLRPLGGVPAILVRREGETALGAA